MQNYEIELIYYTSEDQCVDIFAKAMNKTKFERFTKMFGVKLRKWPLVSIFAYEIKNSLHVISVMKVVDVTVQ